MSFSAVTVKSGGVPLFGSLTLNSDLPAYPIILCTHHASFPSQRVSNFSLFKSRRTLVHDPRKWMHSRSDDEDDENDEDRSLDLLVRFVQNVFKKVSKRTRKAVRSVLPFPISTHLVGFSVNGTLLLTFLWILKAFLQVLCTLGSVVFVSILLIRGIWSGVSFLQENRLQKMDQLHMRNAWNNGAQPVT
ncbi:hypothetical protein LR48_Vigan303s003900 [Vigna angularis]|uniref:Protein SHORT HYPOCOTYL IN WHITE LIGHT 1 n=2 Tax=Phaseolus angularis TaxID=3914 RepID=A0A0L9T7Q0_PHAAN|nr:protein SHORT HYPOCOTYL IN WHITE LIGHT 1 [Vigna angularis]KAG2375441.1 Protein SHORT HYPOCOTYL IN WHITE LIGHT 1 [Vigna angularis]KOM26617.1 hypothetical protein LR48_Vigan303s003900 [Vigna angularis]BAU00828.1 hypothetical protein VIGAN_10246200 [Vigna angularis var. angularis]